MRVAQPVVLSPGNPVFREGMQTASRSDPSGLKGLAEKSSLRVALRRSQVRCFSIVYGTTTKAVPPEVVQKLFSCGLEVLSRSSKIQTPELDRVWEKTLFCCARL